MKRGKIEAHGFKEKNQEEEESFLEELELDDEE